MGLFNWLFSKHTPAPKPSQVDNLEVDIVSKTLYEKVIESVEKQQTAFDYVLENFGWVRDWYDNDEYTQEHKKEYNENRNRFKKELSSLGTPLFTIGRDLLVYEDCYVYLNRKLSSYREASDIFVTKSDIRPPVFRVVKDIYDNFCDWNYRTIEEYNFISVKKLLKRESYSDSEKYVLFYEYSKKGVSISWVSKLGYQKWEDSERKIEFCDNEVSVSSSELFLIRQTFNSHYDNIKNEEYDEIKRKDTELRNQLDAAIAAVL